MFEFPTNGDLGLVEGVVAEPGWGGDRLVVWVSLGHEGKARLWERIASAVGAEVREAGGFLTTPATSYRVSQRDQGAIGWFVRGLVARSSDLGWEPPGGGVVEKVGGRRVDLILAWSLDLEGAEGRIWAHWPGLETIRRLGTSLFVLTGVGAIPEPPVASALDDTSMPTPQLAEDLLVLARKAGDRRAEAGAMTDLGIIQIKAGRPDQAMAPLEAAMAIYHEFGDVARESDVGCYLGTALMATRQPRSGIEMLERALRQVAELGDRFAEKLAQERMGLAYAAVGDPARALACFDRGIILNRELGDRRHESILLWQSAIRLAELGRRDQALEAGRMSVELLRALGDPKAAWYLEHLGQYRDGHPASGLEVAAQVTPGARSSGPGLLKMALTAGQAMAAFLGSGLEKVTPEARRGRLATCEVCEHHTGLRCRLCGCFTAAKSWLPHEDCPIGRWPRKV